MMEVNIYFCCIFLFSFPYFHVIFFGLTLLNVNDACLEFCKDGLIMFSMQSTMSGGKVISLGLPRKSFYVVLFDVSDFWR